MRSITLTHPAVSWWCRRKSAGQTLGGIVQPVGGSSPWCIPKPSGTSWPLESHSESETLELIDTPFNCCSETSVGIYSQFQNSNLEFQNPKFQNLWSCDFVLEDSVSDIFGCFDGFNVIYSCVQIPSASEMMHFTIKYYLTVTSFIS